MRQEVTRAHRGWALDSVVLQSVITRLNKEEVTEHPTEGFFPFFLIPFHTFLSFSSYYSNIWYHIHLMNEK